MTAHDTAAAHALIERELGRIPEDDRGEVASQVLGALTGRYYLIPIPVVEDDATTRAELAALEIPGLVGRGARS